MYKDGVLLGVRSRRGCQGVMLGGGNDGWKDLMSDAWYHSQALFVCLTYTLTCMISRMNDVLVRWPAARTCDNELTV